MANDELEPLRLAFESMTDDEVDEWLAGGNYESVGGVALPAQATASVQALVGGAEVEGFTLSFDVFGGAPPPLLDGVEENKSKGGLLFKYCCQGKHIDRAKIT